MAECPRCYARPPEGYGHQCSNGRWVVEVKPEEVFAEREDRATHLLDDIAEAARRADAMARLEADLRRPA